MLEIDNTYDRRIKSMTIKLDERQTRALKRLVGLTRFLYNQTMTCLSVVMRKNNWDIRTTLPEKGQMALYVAKAIECFFPEYYKIIPTHMYDDVISELYYDVAVCVSENRPAIIKFKRKKSGDNVYRVTTNYKFDENNMTLDLNELGIVTISNRTLKVSDFQNSYLSIQAFNNYNDIVLSIFK